MNEYNQCMTITKYINIMTTGLIFTQPILAKTHPLGKRKSILTNKFKSL